MRPGVAKENGVAPEIIECGSGDVVISVRWQVIGSKCVDRDEHDLNTLAVRQRGFARAGEQQQRGERRRFHAAFHALVIIVFVTAARAQTMSSAIVGRVTSQGKPLVAATVTIDSDSIQSTRSATTSIR